MWDFLPDHSFNLFLFPSLVFKGVTHQIIFFLQQAALVFLLMDKGSLWDSEYWKNQDNNIVKLDLFLTSYVHIHSLQADPPCLKAG